MNSSTGGRRSSRWTSLCICVLLTLTSCVSTPDNTQQTDLNVMTFNIRNGKANDGPNNWDKRKPLVASVISDHAPDVLGLQEAYFFQLEFLLKELPAYRATGTGRNGGKRGEHCSILYNQNRFELLEHNTFWLSDTPDKPSTHWGNRNLRICTWVRLKNKATGHALYVYNTHLDHLSQPSREKSVQLIIKTIANRPHKDPFIFMGDLNAAEDNPIISYLKGHLNNQGISSTPLVDSFRMAHPNETNVGTGSKWNGHSTGPKIDYILVTPETTTHEARIIRTHQNNRYPSDHYPVSARLTLRH